MTLANRGGIVLMFVGLYLLVAALHDKQPLTPVMLLISCTLMLIGMVELLTGK